MHESFRFKKPLIKVDITKRGSVKAPKVEKMPYRPKVIPPKPAVKPG